MKHSVRHSSSIPIPRKEEEEKIQRPKFPPPSFTNMSETQRDIVAANRWNEFRVFRLDPDETKPKTAPASLGKKPIPQVLQNDSLVFTKVQVTEIKNPESSLSKFFLS